MQNLLFLSHRIPYPPNKGDKIRSFHLLRYLSDRYHVHLGTFIDDPDDWRHVDKMERMCTEVQIEALHPLTAKIRSLTALLSGAPLAWPYYANRRLQRWVNTTLRQQDFAAIVVFSSAMAQYVPAASADLPVVIDFADVDSDKWRQYARDKPFPMAWLYRRESVTLLRYDQQAAARATASLFVSAKEADLFRSLVTVPGHTIDYYHNGVDTAYFSPERDYTNPFGAGERALVFTGAMDYWANEDAVTWFAREIFPAIHAAWPEVPLYIVGARPTDAVQALGGIDGVVVTGMVPDVRPYLHHAMAAVAPLRIARGVQNKVLEAMAMGLPVLATAPALEGIEATPVKEVLQLESPAQWQNCVNELLAHADRGAALGHAARQRILQDYVWDHNLERLGRYLQ